MTYFGSPKRLGIDRLSSHRFFANAFQLQCHLLAYALYVLFREANAAVPEVAGHTLETVRARVLKVGAVVQVSTRKVWLHASATWPGRALFGRVCAAVSAYAQRLGRLWGDRLAEGVSAALGGARCGLAPLGQAHRIRDDARVEGQIEPVCHCLS